MKVQIFSFCLLLVLGFIYGQAYEAKLETLIGNNAPIDTKILYIDYNNQNYAQFTNGALVPITLTYVNGLVNPTVLLNTIDPVEFDLLLISAENIAFDSIYSSSDLSTVETVITDFTNAGKAFLLTGFDTIEDPYDSFWISLLGGNGAYDCYLAGNYDFDIFPSSTPQCDVMLEGYSNLEGVDPEVNYAAQTDALGMLDLDCLYYTGGLFPCLLSEQFTGALFSVRPMTNNGAIIWMATGDNDNSTYLEAGKDQFLSGFVQIAYNNILVNYASADSEPPFALIESDTNNCPSETGEIVFYLNGTSLFNTNNLVVGDVIQFFLTSFDASYLPSFFIYFGNCDGGPTCSWVDMGDGFPIQSYFDNVEVQNSFTLNFVLNNTFTYADDGFAIKFSFITYEDFALFQRNGVGITVDDAFVSKYCSSGPADVPDLATITANRDDTIGFPRITISNCASTYQFLSCSSRSFTFDTDPDLCSVDVNGTPFATTNVPITPDPTTCPVVYTFDPVLPAAFPIGPTNFNSVITNPLTDAQDSCTTSVLVEDNQLPEIQCPPSQTVDPRFCEVIIPPVQYSDNCPDPVFAINSVNPGTINFGVTGRNLARNLPPGSTAFLARVVDSSGNEASCSFTLIVLDPFTFPNCPSSSFNLNTDPERCTAFLNVEFEVGIDSCELTPGRELFTNFPAEGYNYPLGTTTYLALSNENKIINTCTFDIVVTDNEPPEITCPPDIVEFTDDISGKVVFFEEPFVDDNCPTTVTLTSTASSGDLFPVGTTNVVFAAADSLFNVTCSLSLSIVFIPSTDTPSQTKIFLPSHSSTEEPTNARTPDPEASRDQISPSQSRTDTRTVNPSVSPTSPPSSSEPPSPSAPPASPSSVPSASRTPAASISRTPDALVIAPSTTPSRYVPSQSPSTTPNVDAFVFVQTSDSALVEIIIQCESTICSQQEAQIYLDLIAISLDIPTSDLILVNIFGDEVTFLICGSNDIADLLNDINFNNPQEFAGVFVESANFDASCNPQEYYFPEDSSIANTIVISSSFIIFISFIISLF